MSPDSKSSACQELLELVHPTFDFLFEDFGFRVVSQEGGPARCLLLVESEECRLRFFNEFGSAGVDIGSTDADPRADYRGGRLQWFGVDRVIEYVRGERLIHEELHAKGKDVWEKTNSEYFSELAARLRPVCQETFSLFRMDAPTERRRAFESYIGVAPPR